MAVESLVTLTGLKPDAERGVAPPSPCKSSSSLVLREEDLPMHVVFGDRRYVIVRTKNGKLVMNGAV